MLFWYSFGLDAFGVLLSVSLIYGDFVTTKSFLRLLLITTSCHALQKMIQDCLQDW